MGTPRFSALNVSNPDFFKQVNGVLESESLDALRTYVTGICSTTPPLAFQSLRGRQFQDAAGP
jgi:hypothetical protein